MRPKLKDSTGKDLEFALDARLDTSRWLTMRGTMQQGRGLQWLDAEARQPGAGESADGDAGRRGTGPRARRAAARSDLQHADGGRNRRRPERPPCGFSFRATSIQSTLKGRIKAHYQQSQSGSAANRPRQPIDVTLSTPPANRVLEIHFTKPLERFRTREGRSARRDSRHRCAAAQTVDADVCHRRRLSHDDQRRNRGTRRSTQNSLRPQRFSTLRIPRVLR